MRAVSMPTMAACLSLAPEGWSLYHERFMVSFNKRTDEACPLSYVAIGNFRLSPAHYRVVHHLFNCR